MIGKGEVLFERNVALDNMIFYEDQGGIINGAMHNYWMGIVTGLELALGILESSAKKIYGWCYEEYSARVWFFFNETFNRTLSETTREGEQ